MSAYDLVTRQEALAQLNREGADLDNDDSTDLDSMITSASALLDQKIGATITRAVTFIGTADDDRLELDQWPVASITSITEYSGTQSLVLTPESPGVAGGYLLKDFGVIIRRTNFCSRCWAWGDRNIVVVYQCGRVATVNLVPDRIKRACLITLRHWWEQDKALGPVGQDGALPVSPRSIPARALNVVSDLVKIQGFA